MATKKSDRRTEGLEPEVVDTLLDLLSTDNAFRRLFKSDPLEALVRAGYRPPAGTSSPVGMGTKSTSIGSDVAPSPATCLKVERIASKQAIARARDEIRSTLVSGLSFIPHMLDATFTASAGKRSARK